MLARRLSDKPAYDIFMFQILVSTPVNFVFCHLLCTSIAFFVADLAVNLRFITLYRRAVKQRSRLAVMLPVLPVATAG